MLYRAVTIIALDDVEGNIIDSVYVLIHSTTHAYEQVQVPDRIRDARRLRSKFVGEHVAGPGHSPTFEFSRQLIHE